MATPGVSVTEKPTMHVTLGFEFLINNSRDNVSVCGRAHEKRQLNVCFLSLQLGQYRLCFWVPFFVASVGYSLFRMFGISCTGFADLKCTERV